MNSGMLTPVPPRTINADTCLPARISACHHLSWSHLSHVPSAATHSLRIIPHAFSFANSSAQRPWKNSRGRPNNAPNYCRTPWQSPTSKGKKNEEEQKKNTVGSSTILEEKKERKEENLPRVGKRKPLECCSKQSKKTFTHEVAVSSILSLGSKWNGGKIKKDIALFIVFQANLRIQLIQLLVFPTKETQHTIL